MRAQANVIFALLSVWLVSAAVCYAQATFEAKPADQAEIKAEIEARKRQLAEAQAKNRTLQESGSNLFGNRKSKVEDTALSTLDLKAPEEYRVGDWGFPSSQAAVFRVVQKVEDGALLITSKKGVWFWLQGIDTSRAAEGIEFRLPRVVAITGTKTYAAVNGASRTVLVIECDDEKVLHEVELARKRDEEAGWRIWTITRVVKRKAAKKAPNIVGPKAPRMPRESKKTYKIVGKFVEAKGGNVSLLNRSALISDGWNARWGEKLETVILKELSASDRQYIKDRLTGGTEKHPSLTMTAKIADAPATPASTHGDDVPRKNGPADGATTIGKEDARTRWINESYDTTIRHVKGKVWQHVDNKTGQVLWTGKETGRGADYIDVVSERNEKLQIMAKRMDLHQGGKWNWAANGHWLPIAGEAADTASSADPIRADTANEDSRDRRSRWVNESYHTTVSRTGDKRWAEVHDQTGDVWNTYVETARTDDYIELYCARTKETIRYQSAKAEFSKGTDHWKWSANGHWDGAGASQGKK